MQTHKFTFICFLYLDLTGGSVIWRIVAYSYISDVSEPEMRTKRIAFCRTDLAKAHCFITPDGYTFI